MCIANGIDTASVSIVVARTYEVNAFATVGNHLVVNTGLISEMDNETQLSAALGHEMAHIQLGHIQKSIRQNAALQAILILVTGNSRSNNIRKITEKLISSGITRAKEREADESGARYIDAMHLDAITRFLILKTMITIKSEPLIFAKCTLQAKSLTARYCLPRHGKQCRKSAVKESVHYNYSYYSLKLST